MDSRPRIVDPICLFDVDVYLEVEDTIKGSAEVVMHAAVVSTAVQVFVFLPGKSFLETMSWDISFLQ